MGWMLLLLVPVLLVFGFALHKRRLPLIRGERAHGSVIEIRRSSHTSYDSEGSTTSYFHTPVVQFETKDRERIIFTATPASSDLPFLGAWSCPSVGDCVDVRYDPGDPEHADIDTWSRLWGMQVGIWCGAIFLLMLALPRLTSSRRDGLNQPVLQQADRVQDDVNSRRDAMTAEKMDPGTIARSGNAPAEKDVVFDAILVRGNRQAGLTARYRQTASSFEDLALTLSQTLRLMNVQGYRGPDGETLFGGIWIDEQQQFGDFHLLSMTESELREQFDTWSSTHRLRSLDGYTDSGEQRFAGVWMPRPPSETEILRLGMNEDELRLENRRQVQNGFWPRVSAGYQGDAGQVKFACTWARSNAETSLEILNTSDFASRCSEQLGRNIPFCVNAIGRGDLRIYSVIWQPLPAGWEWHARSYAEIDDMRDDYFKMKKAGYELHALNAD